MMGEAIQDVAIITLRTSKERSLQRDGEGEAWQTFPAGPGDVFEGGFGRLCALVEDRIPPGGALSAGYAGGGELLTFVNEGALRIEDADAPEILRAGALRRTVARAGAPVEATNASPSEWAQVLRLWLRAPAGDAAEGRETRLFPSADRRGRLALVASQDGRGGSVQLSQDALLHAALLSPGHHVVHELAEGRGVWLHVLRGAVAFGGVTLSSGDGAAVTGAQALSITAREPSSLLLLETGDPPRQALVTGPSCAALFGLLWDACTEVLGATATSAVLKRAVRRALPRHPELGGLELTRAEGGPPYTLPSSFEQALPSAMAALQALLDALGPLLREAAGPAALRRLESVPRLREWAQGAQRGRDVAAPDGPGQAPIPPSAGTARVSTGRAALDRALGGGLPAGSVNLVVGEPGTGKTVLALQILFDAARRGERGIYFTALSEPPPGLLRHAQGFSHRDAALVGDRILLADLGATLGGGDGAATLAAIADRVERDEPSLVVVDGFRAIRDLLGDASRVRRLVHDLAVSCSAWGATTLLLGEYADAEVGTLPEFAVADGVLRLAVRRGEPAAPRTVEVLKLRGSNHARGPLAVEIDDDGLDLLER